jgi:ATP-dependent Clp protease ATP-binding subunit ClpB
LSNVRKIVDIRLKEVQDRLSERKMTLQIDEDAKNFLCASGYSPIYGARPLNRSIQSDLLNPLSVMILSDRVCDGETIRVTFDGPHNRLAIIPNHEGSNADVEMGDYADDLEVEEMD